MESRYSVYADSYWPWFYAPDKLTIDQRKEIGDQLNQYDKRCQRAGLKMVVHNHDKELHLLDGKPVFDRLLELTDPKLVTVEVDLFWVIKAGAGSRMRVLHILALAAMQRRLKEATKRP